MFVHFSLSSSLPGFFSSTSIFARVAVKHGATVVGGQYSMVQTREQPSPEVTLPSSHSSPHSSPSLPQPAALHPGKPIAASIVTSASTPIRWMIVIVPPCGRSARRGCALELQLVLVLVAVV